MTLVKNLCFLGSVFPTHHLELPRRYRGPAVASLPSQESHISGLGLLPDFRLESAVYTPRACTFPPSRRLPRTQDRLQAVPCRGSEALRHAPFPHINRRAWNAETWDWELVQREDGHGISAGWVVAVTSASISVFFRPSRLHLSAHQGSDGP